MALAVDLSDSEQLGGIVESVAARWGGLDVLVNNAGILPAAAPTQSIGLNEWRRIVDVNVTAPWFLACRARDVMVHTGGGVVVNVTSTAAHYPSIGFTQYNSTKAALAMVTRGCALEWARDGVRVVGVAPGRIETDMVKPILAHDAKHRRPPNPQNRVGRPEEVADLIAYLVSDKASYITGSTVAIDGGELLAVGGAGS